MHLANVRVDGEDRVAVADAVDDGLSLAARTLRGAPLASTDDVLAHLGAGTDWATLAAELRDGARPLASAAHADIVWRPAVTRPPRIFCIGLNYRRHARETGAAEPNQPVVFGKFHNALAGHRDVVPLPPASSQVDYEVELVIVIGRRAFQVSEADALSVVAGYTIGNDVSARDLQMATGQWLLGKSCDRFAPIGPYLVSADAVPDPDRLAISLERDGVVVQDSNTADMIFSCRALIAHLSRVWTLEPGDVIFTGTPEGVILGQEPARRRWLAPGETTTARIEGFGALENRFE
jgi:2-keto-4-pentenoate hydratase/2-oxohepta-3-ene-1,7-dioic acid hydratase in catechol pathway